MLESRLKRSLQITRQVTLIGMITGAGVAMIFALIPEAGIWKGLYAGAGIWLASYSLAVQVLARQTGRLRPLLAWALGGMVFLGCILYYQDFLSVWLFSAGLAYLAQRLVNETAYLISPYARYKDQRLDLLSSRKVQADPAAAGKLLQELILRHQKRLVGAIRGDLEKAERQLATKSAAKRYQGVINLLTLDGKPPQDFLPLLGQAYLGLARNQAITQDEALLDTLKVLKDYPLPPGGVAFLAEQYAARHLHDTYAVHAYLDFIREQSSTPVLKSKVYLAAYETCNISASDSPERLKEVEGYARDYFEADPRLSWAALRLGQSLLWQGRSSDALEYLEKAAAAMPGNTDPLYYSGMAHQELGHTQLALDAFRKVLSIAPTHLETWYALGSLLVAGGRAETLPADQRQQALAEARLYLSAVISSQPGRAGAHYGLGLVSYAEGDYPAARQCFEQALSLEASIAEWHYQYARTLIQLKEFPAAIAAVQQAINLDAAFQPALRLLGEELLRAGNWLEAEASFRALVDLDAGGADTAAGLGRALFEQARYAEAMEILKSSTEPHRARLLYLGWAHVRLGDYNAGILAYQKAISHAGPDAELTYRLGCAQASAGKFRPALKSLTQSLELEEAARTYIQIGKVHTALEAWQAAQEAIQKGLELSSSADGWYALGVCWARMGDLQQAEQALQHALELEANFRPAWLAQGALREASGDLAGAQQAYEHAAATGTTDVDTQLRIGVLANRRSLSDQALGVLLAARQAGNQSDQLYYHLGLAQARTGHWDEAIEAWTLLLERQPQDEALGEAVAVCHSERGRQRFVSGDYAGAIQDWEACLAAMEAREGLHKALGEATFRQAAGLLQKVAADPVYLDQASAALEKARSYGKRGEHRLLWLESLLQMVQGDFQPAAEKLAKLHKSDPSDMHLAYHLGFALFRGGHSSQAAPYLQQALEASLSVSQRQAIYLMLADHNAAAEQWAEAAEMYRTGFKMQGAPSGG